MNLSDICTCMKLCSVNLYSSNHLIWLKKLKHTVHTSLFVCLKLCMATCQIEISHKKIKSRLHLGNNCYHTVKNI